MPPAKRSIVYVDGMNLYYGLLRDNPAYKWLNLQRVFQWLRPDDDIQTIKYFTARVLGRSAQTRQLAYLSALGTCPLVRIIQGQFKSRRVKCTVNSCRQPDNKRTFLQPEEKRTDVNIAVNMIEDAHQDLMDKIILVSADSDLIAAIQYIKRYFPQIQVIVYVPAVSETERAYATQIRNMAHKHKDLPINLLPRAQFPDPLDDGRGNLIHRPTEWA